MRWSDPTPIGKSGKRGIIVVDTSALLPMCLELPDEYKSDAAKKEGRVEHVSDLLFFLADHGYEVLIPEAVANECGNFLRDGTSVNDLFGRKSLDSFSAICAHFFPLVPNAPGAIRIVPPFQSEISDGARLARTLWNTIKNKNCDTFKRNDIASTLKDLRDITQAGDDAAVALFLHLRKTQERSDSSIPVFYMSYDVNAMNRINNLATDCFSPNRLNMNGLVDALVAEGVIDIKSTKGFNTKRIICGDNDKAIYDNSFSVDTRINENPSKATHHPFRESLRGLKEEIEAAKPKEQEITPDEEARGKAALENLKTARHDRFTKFKRPGGNGTAGGLPGGGR